MLSSSVLDHGDGTDLFFNGKPKSFSTGVEIQSEIVSDIIGAEEEEASSFQNL